MAKQVGIIRLRGSIGDVTFSRTRYGDVARSKPGVTRERIMNDPAYERTRENMGAMEIVSPRAALFRHAVKEFSNRAKDAKMHLRVDQLFHAVKRADTVSDRDQRNIGTAFETQANRQLLYGFEFNERTPLSKIFLSGYTLDMETGILHFAELNVREELVFPAGATHVFIKGAWAAIDFKVNKFKFSRSNVVILARNAPGQVVSLTPSEVPLNGGDWVVVYLLRVGFSQLMNGVFYPLGDAGFNAMRVVGVR